MPDHIADANKKVQPAPQPEVHIPLIMHPGYGRMQPVTAVLDDLASQENCDGEPYDQMIQASQIIVALARRVRELENDLGAAVEQKVHAIFNLGRCKALLNAANLKLERLRNV